MSGQGGKSGGFFGLWDSRKANPVITNWVISPIRIAEINRAVGQRNGPDWCPDGIGQIGASFHHDGNVGYASDVEAELIVAHTETWPAGLDERAPKHGWKPSISGEIAPTSGT